MADNNFREDPETGQPLPAGVEGHSIGRRKRPDPQRRRLAAQIVAAIDERRWEDMLAAAQDLHAHETLVDEQISEAVRLLRAIDARLRDIPRLVDDAYRQGQAAGGAR